MRKLFIHAKSNSEITLPKEVLSKLPEKLAISTTIQYLHNIHKVRKQLPNALMAGQVLGCRADAARMLKDKIDAMLYIGTGEFHPIQLSLSTDKPVYFWNPETKTFGLLPTDSVEAYKKSTRTGLNRFYHANTVGVLLSTKQGQNNNMITSPTLKNKFAPLKEILSRKDGKKYYVFTFDTLNASEFENFPYIDVWLNLACSRIIDDKLKRLVNWQDIKQYEQEIKNAN